MRAPPLAVKHTKGQALFHAGLHTAYEALAHHRAHRSAHKTEFERCRNQWYGFDAALHHHQRIVFIGISFRLRQPIDITLAVLEFKRIERLHFRADLVAALGIQKQIEAHPGGNAVVMIALGADVEIVSQVRVVQHGLAGSALAPQSFGHGFFFAAFLALDFRREKFLKPAHKFAR